MMRGHKFKLLNFRGSQGQMGWEPNHLIDLRDDVSAHHTLGKVTSLLKTFIL